MAETAPALKDAAVAVLGAYATFAGIVLVLIGFLFLQAGSYDRDDKRIGNRYRFVGKIGLIPFVMCNAVVFFATLDLLRAPPDLSAMTFWVSTASLFVVTLYALWTFLVYLK